MSADPLLHIHLYRGAPPVRSWSKYLAKKGQSA
jgi:hypothetical protein